LDLTNLTISQVKNLLQYKHISNTLLSAMESDKRKGIQKLLVRYYREQDKTLKKQKKSEVMLSEERKLWSMGYTYLAGIDEAGRGPLAGPVVSACVILPKDCVLMGINDSKKLTSKKREEYFNVIMEKAVSVGIGIVDNNRIDRINIYNATIEAMIHAVNKSKIKPDFLLLDAMKLNSIPIPQISFIGGDARSQTIAAASIIAKVTRDKIMIDFAKLYPEYGFDKHKGYATKIHINAIRKYGYTPIHRTSFLTNILS